jgi:four helix bundle protein
MKKDEQPSDLQWRTKQYALRIIRLFSALPKTPEAQVIGRQLLRSGTSVGAHYREAKRARSNAEFVSKLDIALQELDETGYWIELLAESGLVVSDQLSSIANETEQLIAIFTSIVKKVKGTPP